MHRFFDFTLIQYLNGRNKFAPREIFEQILEWSVVPTFDLFIEYGTEGVILVKRNLVQYIGMFTTENNR